MIKQQKRLRDFRQGRVNVRAERRRQLVLRNNLEKRFFKRLNTLFRKFVRVQMFLYSEYGIYDRENSVRILNEDFFPLMLSHYKRIFKSIYKMNESKYKSNYKQEAYVFDRSVDIENLVTQYFNTRQLVLTGISLHLADRIAKTIESARADNLTLPQIAKLVTDKFLPISRSRANVIARTETHSAASFVNHSYHNTLQQDLGITMVKQWSATNDARTRTTHAQANGQQVLMDEDFEVGGVAMGYAGDPRGGVKNVVNCRCVIIYADEQDIVLD